MRRYPSHPKFAEVNFLHTMYARLKNKTVHFDLKDVPQEELDKEIDDLELALEIMFLLDKETYEYG